MNERDALIYLAGFFDGEGCAYIIRAKRPYGLSYSLEINFANSGLAPFVGAQIIPPGRAEMFR